MRIHVLSDLHLEFGSFVPTEVEADVVVLAGDVHTGRNGIRWILEAFPDRPVVYVLGNHEFYGQKFPRLIETIKAEAAGTNVHVLENEKVEIGSAVFLGATLWTDFKLHGNKVLAEIDASDRMTDFRRIRVTPGYRRYRPSDAAVACARSVNWLLEESKVESGKNKIVVTHHAPSARSLPECFAGDSLSPAYASNLEEVIEQVGAGLWIHGHIHEAVDYWVGGTRVRSNPRGYPGERSGFDSSLVLTV